MSWSTRELAELAGTTVNTVRHYHRIGLLDEPERRYNGYKQYEVRHLVSLLRIRRLAELGVPLSQIGDVGAGTDRTPEALRDLAAELTVTIERLTSAREEIATILRAQAPAHVPAGFASVASRLSEADSSMIQIYPQLFDQEALVDVQQLVADDVDDLGAEVERLPTDADEQTRRTLVERLATALARNVVDYPWSNDPAAHLSQSGRVTAEEFVEAVGELYNSAQLDVLVRASALAREQVSRGSGRAGHRSQRPGNSTDSSA